MCGSQVEGSDTQFDCVYNESHYTAYVSDDTVLPFIYKEYVIVIDKDSQYEIIKHYNDNTYVYVSKIDAVDRRIMEVPSLLFKSNEKLFDFSQTNREKIINRLRTILVFQ